MAIRHFNKYLEEIEAQYHEMNNNLKEMEELAQNGMIKPEMLDNLKNMIAPIYNNWRTLNYIKFLLDMPNRKNKEKSYEKRMKKALSNCKTKDEVLNEGKETLKSLKSLKLKD